MSETRISTEIVLEPIPVFRQFVAATLVCVLAVMVHADRLAQGFAA